MTRYRYIGELPLVLATHSHGRNATVFPVGEEIPEHLLDGSTVVLNPGDEVETDDPIGHLLIIPTDISLAKLKKDDLVELAAVWGVDPHGTAPELRDRLEGYIGPQDGTPLAAGDVVAPVTNGTESVSTPGDESPTPQTGAQRVDETEGA